MNRKSKIIFVTAVVAILTTGSAFFTSKGIFQRFDNIYYDLWHLVLGKRAEAAHTVIASIDDDTLFAHQDEPLVFWSPRFARAAEVLKKAGAKVVGVDFLFAVSAESWLKKIDLGESQASRTYDAAFRRQLAEGGIVLIKLLAADENGEGRPLLPIDGYRYRPDGAMTDMAFANLATDPDGVVRTFVPVLFGDGTAEELIFGTLLAVRASGQDPAAPKWRFGGETVEHSPHFKEIGFSGPPGTIPRIRFEKLLAPGAENDPHVASLVSDKVVIIAGEHVGSQDVHLTPYSSGIFGSESRLMKGAEIHANVVETLLSGRRPKNAPLWLCVAVSLIFITAGTAVFIRLNAWRGLATGVVMITALPFISLLLFATGIFVPAIGTQVALVVSFLSTMGLRLTGEERERARLRKIFGNYVSHEVVEKLLASGRHPDLGGEESHVTVLFSDIRNFTTISERLGPHEVVEMLNTYFSRAVEPILEQGGTVDKFIGDAIMAVFGEPANYPDHARRALLAALKMADNAREFRGWMNERFAGRNLPEFNIGIGLHTGPAVSGNVGSPRRMQYTVIGDTVNTASRLESKTKELGVMILASAATVQAAGAGVETGLKSTLTVKGKDEPVEVCEIKSLY